MKEHILKINGPAKAIPTNALPDGAITGNGDVSVVLSGGPDRIHLHINKADFWKADGRVEKEMVGGIAPLGMAEILLPQLAYAEYNVEQNLDKAYIELSLKEKYFDAKLKITVCATANVILLELDRKFPAVSASMSLIPIDGYESVSYSGDVKDATYTVRGFDYPECRFPNYGICAARMISRKIENGRERIVWAITVYTNHDSAAYKDQAIEKVLDIEERDCEKLLCEHAEWWKNFWSKSSVTLSDEFLELHWYAGLYTMACCARNKKFPPGLWGSYVTKDGMGWLGDYHLNYNYEAPFYALTSCNHTELLECYMPPINDYLPTAKRYAKEFFGVRGAIFPVGLGPLGLETDVRPKTKEHGHLFHGQKSNGAYAAVIPMMHWYGTRDTEFAKREYYDFLLSIADFWEDYLVFEDGCYQIYNDSLNETCWYCGPDAMPSGHDDKNPIVSNALVRMIMKLVIDISKELGKNTDRIHKWQHILDNMVEPKTFESNGEKVLCGIDGSTELRELALESMFPAGSIGKYSTPEIYEYAKNTHKQLAIWMSDNRFCGYYPMAARLEYSAEEIIKHINEVIAERGLPNGMVRFGGGGLENSASIPMTVNEMLLQSYEDIIRLFPVWDRSRDASFKNLRAYGAFLVSGSVENGIIKAEIVSEKGRSLTVEKPDDGYVILTGDGRKIALTEKFTTVNTVKGEKLTVTKA